MAGDGDSGEALGADTGNETARAGTDESGEDTDDGSGGDTGDGSGGDTGDESGEDTGDGSGGDTGDGSGVSAESSDEGFTFEDYYDLLGVPADASPDEIQRAYREMAKQHHPDASDRPEAAAERRFRQLLTARDVLTNAERRRAYNELGHEAYCRQSAELGEPVGRSGVSGDDEPEPRPEPSADESRVQRSARGEAVRRGDPVVTDTTAAFGPTTPVEGERDDPSRSQSAGGDSNIYRLTPEDTPSSRSLELVARRWTRAWRTRALVGLGGVLVVAAALAALPAVLDAAGVDRSVPEVTAGRLYAFALVATVAHTAYSCVASETQLPRGEFLADRDHGRFSAAAGGRYRRRGFVALAVACGLAVAGAGNGVDPWGRAAAALQGDLPESFPWFDAPDAGWTGGLDAVLSGVFAVTVAGGTLCLAVGASLALWRGRYERGLRVRPSLWEPALVAGVVSAPVTLVAGPVALVSQAPLAGVPEPVALLVGIDGTTVTTATVTSAGVVLAVVSVSLLRVRAALAETGEPG